MNRRFLAAGLLSLAGLAGVLAFAPRRVAEPPELVARGRYLVDGVAMCAECHTSRDKSGGLDSSRWLQGARIWIVPVRPRPDWGHRAPALAGLASHTDAQLEDVLERGRGPNGLPLQAPMHVYSMTARDAAAVIAYLRSLPAPR